MSADVNLNYLDIFTNCFLIHRARNRFRSNKHRMFRGIGKCEIDRKAFFAAPISEREKKINYRNIRFPAEPTFSPPAQQIRSIKP